MVETVMAMMDITLVVSASSLSLFSPDIHIMF